MLKKSLSFTSTLLGITAISYLSVTYSAQAQITNGGFETGSFTGWQRLEEFINVPEIPLDSLTSIQTATYGTATKTGNFHGLINFPVGDPANAPLNLAFPADIDDFLGLTTNLNVLDVYTGSAIKQTITVNTPSTLSFSFNFLSDESTSGTPQNDFSFYSLNGTLTQLADVNGSTFISSSTPFSDETGYQDISLTLAPGTYTLGFGVASVGDSEGLSGILIDDVTITPDDVPTTTPEPSMIFGSLLMLGAGSLIRKKHK